MASAIPPVDDRPITKVSVPSATPDIFLTTESSSNMQVSLGPSLLHNTLSSIDFQKPSLLDSHDSTASRGNTLPPIHVLSKRMGTPAAFLLGDGAMAPLPRVAMGQAASIIAVPPSSVSARPSRLAPIHQLKLSAAESHAKSEELVARIDLLCDELAMRHAESLELSITMQSTLSDEEKDAARRLYDEITFALGGLEEEEEVAFGNSKSKTTTPRRSRVESRSHPLLLMPGTRAASLASAEATSVSSRHQVMESMSIGSSSLSKISSTWQKSRDSGSLSISEMQHADDAKINQIMDRALAKVEEVSRSSTDAHKQTAEFIYGMKVVTESWLEIRNGYFDAFAEALYAHMLASHPHYAQLFPYSDDVKRQGLAVAQMIGYAVAAQPLPDDLIDMMDEMGARHFLYGVHREHYECLRDAFLATYPQFVSTRTYMKAMKAWPNAWATMLQLLDHGSRTARANKFIKIRRDKWATELQSAIGLLVGLQLAPMDCERRNRFVYKMYEIMTAAHPHLEKYHKLIELSAADRSFEALVQIVDHLRDYEVVTAYVQQLGVAHTDMGLTIDDFKLAKSAFLQACEYFLGASGDAGRPDEAGFTPQLEKSLGEFWDFIAEAWDTVLNSPETDFITRNAPKKTDAEPFCLIFTDIEAGTRLWNRSPRLMEAATAQHNSLVRSVINDHGGYEVKIVGESFMIATRDALIALKIALGIQLALMRAPIAEGFEMVGDTQGGGDDKCWRKDSLRVRIGIHYCTEATAVFDRIQRRYDYYGPSVNLAARVGAVAYGGEVLLTKAVLDALRDTQDFYTQPRPPTLSGIVTEHSRVSDDTESNAAEAPPLSELVTVSHVGQQSLRGIADKVTLYAVAHTALTGRLLHPPTEEGMDMVT